MGFTNMENECKIALVLITAATVDVCSIFYAMEKNALKKKLERCNDCCVHGKKERDGLWKRESLDEDPERKRNDGGVGHSLQNKKLTLWIEISGFPQ